MNQTKSLWSEVNLNVGKVYNSIECPKDKSFIYGWLKHPPTERKENRNGHIVTILESSYEHGRWPKALHEITETEAKSTTTEGECKEPTIQELMDLITMYSMDLITMYSYGESQRARKIVSLAEEKLIKLLEES